MINKGNKSIKCTSGNWINQNEPFSVEYKEIIYWKRKWRRYTLTRYKQCYKKKIAISKRENITEINQQDLQDNSAFVP